MKPHDLKLHKNSKKQLQVVPEFKTRKNLARPFHKLKGPRIQSTGFIEVSNEYVAFMYWRDGQILTDRSFFGYLFSRLDTNNLYPVFEFHWHPSHKGVHCKMPCLTDSDYTNRHLPGAPELALKTKKLYDPKDSTDLDALVILFCKSCGISLPSNDTNTAQLWPQ